MGMKYPSELKLEYSVNEKYNKTVDLYKSNISRTGSTVLFFYTDFTFSGENFTKDSYHEKRRNEK